MCDPCPGGFTCTDNMKTICLAGTFSDGTFDNCKPCPAGSYCAGNGTEIPSICTHNRFSYAGSSTCSMCPDGKKCASGLIDDCPPGYKCFNATVAKCPRGTKAVGGSSTCDICPPGTYSLEASNKCLQCPSSFMCSDPSLEPVLCPNGTYCPAGVTELRGCPAGFYCPTPADSVSCKLTEYCPTNSTQPVKCPKEYYCASPEFAKVCEVGYYCPEGSTSAKDCKLDIATRVVKDPFLTTRLNGSESIEDCVCSSSYFMDAAGMCSKCPYGLVCDEAGSTFLRPVLMEGYIFPPDRAAESIAPLACPIKSACTNGTCNIDLYFTGFQCKSCLSGYFMSVKNECEACKDQLLFLQFPGTALVLGLVLSLFTMLKLKGYTEKLIEVEATKKLVKGEIVDVRRTKTGVLQRILINKLQMISILARFKLDWPLTKQQLYRPGTVIFTTIKQLQKKKKLRTTLMHEKLFTDIKNT
jgi:hypothetical protein